MQRACVRRSGRRGPLPARRTVTSPHAPSSQVGLLPPSPLGTDRESFPSISSSLPNALLRTRFHHFQLQAMYLSMAFWVKQHEVFCCLFAPIRFPDDRVAMPLGDLLLTNWTDSLLLLI